MNVQNKKKATIGVAVAAVGAAAIALGAGTFASFSSTQEGPDTTLAAGTLDFGDSADVTENLGPFVPGGAPEIRTMTFTNADSSSLPGDVSLAFTLEDALDNGCNGDEVDFDPTCGTGGDPGELQDKLNVTVTSGGTELYDGALSGLSTSTAVGTPDVAPTESVTYTFEFTLPDVDETDNAVQGDSVTLKTTATLEQS